MRMIRGFGHPGDSDVPAGDSHDYATWDAAYVLGSLSPTDRREYEAHLSVCPFCNQAVSELSGMPALLSKLDGGTVAAMGADDLTPAPNLLPSLLSEVYRRRRGPACPRCRWPRSLPMSWPRRCRSAASTGAPTSTSTVSAWPR